MSNPVPLESVAPSSSVVPLESVIPGDTLPPVPASAPPQPAPAQAAEASQTDQSTQAEYLKWRASGYQPENVDREALQYKLLHPEMSFDAISKNLDTLRAQATAERVNWQAVTRQHPELAKLIQRDPATMHLALSEAGTLQGTQSFLGFTPDASDPAGYRFVTPGVIEQFGRGALYGTNAALYGAGRVFATAAAMLNEKLGLSDNFDWDRGIFYKNGKLSFSMGQPIVGYRGLADYFARNQRWNEDRVHIDTHGDELKGSGTLVRGAYGAVDTMASLLPYAAELAATKGLGGSTLAFNTLMNAGSIFDTLKEKGVSDEKALGTTALGAPVVGKIMEMSPLSRLNTAFATSTTRSALDRLLSGEGVSLARAIWAGTARSGLDAMSGQIALGLQRGAMQLATSTNGKDLQEVPLEALRGAFTDPSLLGFHATALAATMGRTMRSVHDLKNLHSYLDNVAAQGTDPAAATLHEQTTQAVANQPAAYRAIYLPVDRFLEAADKLGKDPRQLATEVMQDGGAAYDVALATHSEHLKIPVERTAAAGKAGLTDAIREHGRFEQSLMSTSELEAQADEIKTTFAAEYAKAAKIDPANIENGGLGLDPDTVKLWKLAATHAQVVAMEDGTAIPRLIAEVRTLAKLHPEMTHKEIFASLFGKNGIYGTEAHQQGGKAPSDAPAPNRLVEMARTLTGHDDQRWFNVFKDEQEKAAAKEATAKADDASTEDLKRALVNNDRRMMDGARDAALTEAKRQAAKSPVLAAIRAIRGDHEGLSPEQRAALTREDGKPYRLLASQIDSILGPGSAETLKEKLGSAITENPKLAIDARDLAQVLGFDHAPNGLAEKNLLLQIFNSPTEKEFVEKSAQAVLDQRYGPDLLSNPAPLMGAALDAVHTPQATERLIALHRKLAEGLDPTTRARSALTAEQWLDHARRLVGLKALEEIDPHFFAKSEGSRIRRALDAADQGNAREAAQHAESALLYHHLYMAAREASDAAGKAQRDLARTAASELPVKRLGFADPVAGQDGMNHYQRAREGALVAAGLLPERAGTDYSTAVADVLTRAEEIGHGEYLDGLNWNKDLVQKLIDNKAGWGALTLDEARQLHAFTRNLDTIGKNIEEAHGENHDDRSANIAKYLMGGEQPGSTRKPTDPLYLDRNLQKKEEQAGAKGVLRQIKDRLMAVPKMLGMTDTPSNWQSELLLRHLGPEGVDIQALKRTAYILRDKIFKELYQPWKEIHDKTMLDPKVHEEAVGAIDMLDPGRKGQVDVDRVTYGYLLNLARWYGDADGRNRVLKGFGLEPGRVEKTLEKYLTPEQLGHIQAEKDLIDREWYPRLADAFLRRTGNPLPRSEAASFTLHGTEYRGGHVQLTYDDRPGAGLDLRRGLNDTSLGVRATMEGGFFHERAGSPAALPDLSNLTAPQTMVDMAHHLAVGDFLLTAKEILLNPDTAGVINRYVGDNAARVLQGWLSRIATETRGGPDKIEDGQRESLRAMRVVRSGVILAATSGKLRIPFAHATHPFLVGAMLHGPGFAAKYTLPAFNEMLTSTANWLATGHNDFVEAAQADSAYLRLRATSTPDDIARLYFEREVAQSGAPKAAIEKVMDGVETFGTLPLRIMDEVFSSTIYKARYNHAMDTLDRSQFANHDVLHEEAVRLAEAETERSMPNFAQHAISSFAASKGGFQSMITPLMGYYATVRDLYRSQVFEKVDGGLRRYEAAHGTEAPAWYRTGQAIAWQAALSLPVVLGLGLGAYLKGAGPPVEEEPPEWAQLGAGYWQREFWPTAGGFFTSAARETAVRMSELHPLLGHAAERADESIGSRRATDYAPSNLLFSPFSDVGRAIEKTRLERYSAGDAALSWGRAISPAAGLPAAPIVNVGGLLVNHEEFMSNLPSSRAAQTLDVLDHLIYAHQYGRGTKYQRRTPLSDLKDAVETAATTDKGAARRLPW